MASLFSRRRPAPTGKRLTGFSRYTELLGMHLKRYMIVNLFTIIAFIPLALGIFFSIMSTSILVLIPSCILGGMIAGPGLSAMLDCIYRSFRDASGKILPDYKNALKKNFKASLIPGILLGIMTGFYSFTFMLFYWSRVFPGWNRIIMLLLSLFLFIMIMSICWPQIILFTMPAKQMLVNALLFTSTFFWRMAGITVLTMAYLAVMVLLFPPSILLILITGFWFILFTTNFIIYEPLNQSFKLEEIISEKFPEQTPFYETDEEWLNRKQE